MQQNQVFLRGGTYDQFLFGLENFGLTSIYFQEILHRVSYMSAHVLLNLLNKLGKRDKNARLAEHFISL